MGGKPRKKPNMAPSAENIGVLVKMHAEAVAELMAEEDRKFLDYIRGIQNGR